MGWERAIVIGASSGIGAALATALAQRGTRVAAIARRKDALEQVAAGGEGRISVHVHDVTDVDEAPLLFDRIVDELGGLDLVVYAAGVMPEVEEGEYDSRKDLATIQTNLAGAVAWLNPAVAYMEARGRGTIAGISSVAGDRGRRGNPVYTASKAGLSAYLEALRNRSTRYGVTVVTIKPGPVETPMTAGTKQPLMIPVDRCVSRILSVLDSGRSTTAYVPGFWRLIMFVVRSVPSALFRRTHI